MTAGETGGGDRPDRADGADVASADGVFVAGTDTGVGKTVVAAGLAAALREQDADVGAIKPVETGCDRGPDGALEPEDAAVLGSSVGPGRTYCPRRFEEPLAPRVAAERAGDPLEYDWLRGAVDRAIGIHDVAVVEGVGGVRVPLAGDAEVVDLVADVGLPTIVVADAGLGTLNHTALTVDALRQRDVEVAGVVLTRWPDEPDIATETNPGELRRMCDVAVLARLPAGADDPVAVATEALDPLAQRLGAAASETP